MLNSYFLITSSLLVSNVICTSQNLIDEVNSHQASWTAVIHKRFTNATIKELSSLCGVLSMDEDKIDPLPDFSRVYEPPLPDDYDCETASHVCGHIIGHVKDQSMCGSCWAFGSTSAFNDRRCLMYGDQTIYSPEDTLSCCYGLKCGMSRGCDGGQPSFAWKWFVSTGVTSGGDFGDMNTGKTCNPYPFPSCTHNPDDKHLPICPSKEYTANKCSQTCLDDKYIMGYKEDKVFAKTAYTIKGEIAIKNDLVRYGPVTAAFTVYEDFMAYSNGVYHHVTGEALGGHAVEIVGYGIDPISKKPFWRVKNSWSSDWGENGFFRILRGENECGIEDNISAGLV